MFIMITDGMDEGIKSVMDYRLKKVHDLNDKASLMILKEDYKGALSTVQRALELYQTFFCSSDRNLAIDLDNKNSLLLDRLQ